MAKTTKWDESSPAGSDDPRDGDDEIRSFKLAMYERLVDGGHYWDTSPEAAPGDADAGKHACGVAAANKFYVYETDKTAIALTVDDSALAITAGDGLTVAHGGSGSNPYTFVADTLTGVRYSSATVVLPGIAGYIEGAFLHNLGSGSWHIDQVRVTCFSAPVTTAFELDVLAYVPDLTTDPTSGGVSILNTNLSVAASQFSSNLYSTGDFTGAADEYELLAGSALLFNVTALSQADAIMVAFRGYRTV